MFGGTHSSFGLVVAAVAAVIGTAIGNLLVRHYVVALAGLGAYGLLALGLYYWAAARRSLTRLLHSPASGTAEAASKETAVPLESAEEQALTQRPESGGEPTGSGQHLAEAWRRRKRALRAGSGIAVLAVILAACCYVLGYWGIGNGFAHGPGWGTLSLLITLIIAVLVTRRWPRSRNRYLRYRLSTAAMACCLAAAGLWAGATLGATNLVPPCPPPAELTVLTSADDLAAVQAAIPGFEQNEPARVHTACYTVDVTAYAAPTDSDVWHGLESGWRGPALSTIGPRPDVWIPGSSAEVTEVREHEGSRLTSLTSLGSIGSSPLVVAVPTGLANGPLAGLLPEVGSTWGSIYDALAGLNVRLAVPDPAVSETGLLGIAGLYPNLSRADKREIESAGNFPADSENLLCEAAQTIEGDDKAPVIAYLVSEAALIASNADQLTGTACAALTDRRRGR